MDPFSYLCFMFIFIILSCLTAVFSTFTRTGLILEKVWLEFESSEINSSVIGVQVFTTFTRPSLT